MRFYQMIFFNERPAFTDMIQQVCNKEVTDDNRDQGFNLCYIYLSKNISIIVQL